MGVLAKDDRQLKYIYSSNSDLGKKVYAYVRGLDLEITTADISKDNLGDTVWIEIRDLLKMDFDKILDMKHPDAPDLVEDGNFDSDGWLKILNKNPDLLQNPIAINGEKARLISSRADILNFFSVESAGIEQNTTSKDLDISSNSKNEDFVPENKG